MCVQELKNSCTHIFCLNYLQKSYDKREIISVKKLKKKIVLVVIMYQHVVLNKLIIMKWYKIETWYHKMYNHKRICFKNRVRIPAKNVLCISREVFKNNIFLS